MTALASINTIGEYLNTYGPLIGEQAQTALNPLHIPAQHPPLNFSDLRRAPLPAQAHAITACVKQLKRDRACFLIGEQGTGKSIMAIATAHNLARSPVTGLVEPYRAIIMCPPHLTHKWEREIRKTISGSEVIQLRHVRQLMVMRNHTSPNHEPVPRDRPTSFEWWIVKENIAKSGASWRPAFTQRPHEPFARCSSCGQPIADKDGVPVPASAFDDRLLLHQYTPGDGAPKDGCLEPLWTFCRTDSGRALWAIARYARTHLKRFFDIAIFDEAHENRGRESARAIAMSQFASASRCALSLTGTFAGGYAWQIRTLLMRTAPQSLVNEGISWKDETRFNELYGRIETKIISTSSGVSESANKTSQGKSRTTRKSVKPGIMPTLFGRHMIDKCVFLALDEMVMNLPLLKESVHTAEMDPDVAEEYERIELTLRAAIAEMLQKGDKRLLGSMLRVLLTYPNHPYGFETIGYTENGLTPDGIPTTQFVPVVTPKDLSPDFKNKEGKLVPRALEQKLLDALVARKKLGHQCWVYVQNTNKYDIQERIKELVEDRGMTCRILRSNTVSTEDREEWIEEFGSSTDVMISHPALVQTGLDLFSQNRDEKGEISGHNFSALMFFETGYESFVLRQAGRRAWRIGQKRNCEVLYFYYKGTMQERAMSLMGKKIATSNAIEGKFTDGGLSSLGDDVDSIEIELARSLLQTFDDSVTQRSWTRTSGNSMIAEQVAEVPVDSINKPVVLKKKRMFRS